jgi:hypothetical protein
MLSLALAISLWLAESDLDVCRQAVVNHCVEVCAERSPLDTTGQPTCKPELYEACVAAGEQLCRARFPEGPS